MSHIFFYINVHIMSKCTMVEIVRRKHIFGIRYEEANDKYNQLLYFLRLADNFDSTQDRLLSVQRNALNKFLPFAKTYMEEYFEDPSQYHVGSWPWFAILERSKLSVELTISEYNALEKIIFIDKAYKPGIIKANSLNNQFRYYIGLWLVSDISLIKSKKTIKLKVTLKQDPWNHETITFLKIRHVCPMVKKVNEHF